MKYIQQNSALKHTVPKHEHANNIINQKITSSKHPSGPSHCTFPHHLFRALCKLQPTVWLIAMTNQPRHLNADPPKMVGVIELKAEYFAGKRVE